MFNNIFSYLFINSKINSLLLYTAVYDNSSSIRRINTEGFEAKSIYKKQIRRYLGLGFLSSFIPGTEAFLARKNLLSVIKRIELKVNEFNVDSLLGKIITSPAHIFARTLLFIPTLFSQKILEREDISFWGLNRLNPFLYLSQLIKYIFSMANIIQIDSWWQRPLLLLVTMVPGLILGLIFIISIPLFIITELILNSLCTLLVEPLIFSYEVIHQLLTDWSMKFSYLPSDDFLKLTRLLLITQTEDATFKVRIFSKWSRRYEINQGDYYMTSELALLTAPEEVISCYEKHRNSFFFETYKRTLLFQEDNQTIATAYNDLENLRIFSYFSRDLLPKDLMRSIIAICLKLDWSSALEAETTALTMELLHINLLTEKIHLSQQVLNPNILFTLNNLQAELCINKAYVEDLKSKIENIDVSIDELEEREKNLVIRLSKLRTKINKFRHYSDTTPHVSLRVCEPAECQNMSNFGSCLR